MRKGWIVIGLGAASLVVALPFALAPREVRRTPIAVPAVGASEQARTIEAMRPPKRSRPVIAVLGLNEATEIADVLTTYGVLHEANVADVTLVAPMAAPIRLYPGRLSVEPQATTRAYDQRHPDGADYVIVPAMQPSRDPAVLEWITAQHRKGARIVSVCYGALTVAATGLLDGRRATTHWFKRQQLQAEHPSMRWVPDRRYVADSGIVTSTGVTASIPAMIALVQAIGGEETAARVARDLGVENWDARHDSSAFQLTLEHRKTFLRNKLAFWRHETAALPLGENVDEIALGLTVDAYSRTEIAEVATVAPGGAAVRSRRGLLIRPEARTGAAAAEVTLPPPSPVEPARTLDRVLAHIAARYDPPTAALVALTLEYPWASSGAGRHATAVATSAAEGA